MTQEDATMARRLKAKEHRPKAASWLRQKNSSQLNKQKKKKGGGGEERHFPFLASCKHYVVTQRGVRIAEAVE